MRFGERREELAIIACFTLLSLFLVAYHEPWRDEAQAWLIVRDAKGLAEIAHLMGYEGSPALWHMILYPFVKLGFPYQTMNVVHSLLMVAAVAVFVLESPYTKTQKALFAAGYYVAYEYNAIARTYSMTALFLMLAAAYYGRKQKTPVPYCLFLALLANTNVFGLIIAAVLAFDFAYDVFNVGGKAFRRNLVSLAVPALGFATALYQLLPPPDIATHLKVWYFKPGSLLEAFSALDHAYMPLTWVQRDFWVSPINHHLGIVLFLASLTLFVRKPRALLLYAATTGSLFFIFAFKNLGTLRHHGILYLLLVLCLWIAHYSREDNRLVRLLARKFSRMGRSVVFEYLSTRQGRQRLVTAFVALQVIPTPVALYNEYMYDFSAAQKTAAFLVANGFDREGVRLVSLPPSYAASSVLPYLRQEHASVYSPEFRKTMSYIVWDRTYETNGSIPFPEAMRRTGEDVVYADNRTTVVLLGHGRSRYGGFNTTWGVYEKIAYFGPTIVGEEAYTVYLLSRSQPWSNPLP